MKQIIGLLGKAGSGKTTVANHLHQKHGFRVFSFSKPIKEMAMAYFNVSYEEAFSSKPPHVRRLLQGIGTFIRENINAEFFLDEMRLRVYYSDADYIVIDDVRLKEEAEFIKSLDGGIVVKVECPDSQQSLSESQQTHITEQIDAIPYDHMISACLGNLASLEEQIDEILETLELLSIPNFQKECKKGLEEISAGGGKDLSEIKVYPNSIVEIHASDIAEIIDRKLKEK